MSHDDRNVFDRITEPLERPMLSPWMAGAFFWIAVVVGLVMLFDYVKSPGPSTPPVISYPLPNLTLPDFSSILAQNIVFLAWLTIFLLTFAPLAFLNYRTHYRNPFLLALIIAAAIHLSFLSIYSFFYDLFAKPGVPPIAALLFPLFVLPGIATYLSLAHIPRAKEYILELPLISEARRRFTNLYVRLTARPPPTPLQTQQAQIQMQAVLSHIADLEKPDLGAAKPLHPWEHSHASMAILTNASRNLKKARKLDPAARLEVTDKEGTVVYKQDLLASMLLYLQSQTHEMAGRNYGYNSQQLAKHHKYESSLTYKDIAKQEQGHYRKALDAASRAIRYNPESKIFIIQYATCLHLCGNRRAARRFMAEAVARHPDNIDLIKKQQELQ